MQEAKLIYFGFILLSIYICWSLLDSFFSHPAFGSFLTFGVVTTGLFFFYLKILKIAYLNSTSLRTNDRPNPQEGSEKSNYLKYQKYLNEKHANDPEEIKRAKIYSKAETFFYEGETTAKHMYAAPAASLTLTKFIVAVMAGVSLYLWMTASDVGKLTIVAFLLVPIIYLLYRIAIYERDKPIFEAAYQLSLQWRDDYNTRITNERVHGVKGWADQEKCKATFASSAGIYIGGGYYWSGLGHILTVGSNRAGKGTNLIIPCLLSDGFVRSETSFVCMDPKGENAAITAKYLKSQGYNIHILNPFEISGLPNSKFNPFNFISSDDDNVIEYCDMLAEMVIPLKSNSDSNSEHFDTQARSILSSFMLHLIDTASKEDQNFTTLFRWVNSGGAKLDALMSEMIASTSYRGILSAIIEGFNETRMSGGEKEISGIFSTLKKALEPFKNFKLQDSTARSDFDFRNIAKEKMGIYVCIPQSEMEKYAVWLRLVIGCSIKLLQKHYSKQKKVLFIMDEFSTLGYMKDFETNAGYMAGFNVTFWVILQLLPQIQNLYPKIWETFIGNAVVKQFLGIGDQTTASYVSQLLPDAIVMDDRGHVIKTKKLLDPVEVFSYEPIIVKFSNVDQPFSFSKIPYHENTIYNSRAGERPLM
jgi:type IV secretion system protein VirD4